MDVIVTVIDSCSLFISNYSSSIVKEIFDMTNNLVKNQMKNVWKARGLHHLTLLLDGIVKQRCCLTDFDDNFTAKKEDYDMLIRIATYMIGTWDTNVGVPLYDQWKEKY